MNKVCDNCKNIELMLDEACAICDRSNASIDALDDAREFIKIQAKKIVVQNKMITGLKLYFDIATINELNLYRDLGKLKYERHKKAVNLMFNTYPDEA
jgi:hypothetical protein